MLLVGSLSHSNGRDTCWVYDLNSAATTEMMQLHPPDVQTGIRFGANTAWSGNTAVIAAPDDSPLINNVKAVNAGSIYLMRPITRPMPLTKVAAKISQMLYLPTNALSLSMARDRKSSACMVSPMVRLARAAQGHAMG